MPRRVRLVKTPSGTRAQPVVFTVPTAGKDVLARFVQCPGFRWRSPKGSPPNQAMTRTTCIERGRTSPTESVYGHSDTVPATPCGLPPLFRAAHLSTHTFSRNK